MFENYVFYVFLQIKNSTTFTFFEMTYQKSLKSRTKVSSLLNVHRNVGLPTPGYYGYLSAVHTGDYSRQCGQGFTVYRRLPHTVLSCSFLCPHF